MTETTIPTPPSKRPFTTDERALKVMPNGDVMHGLHRIATLKHNIPENQRVFYKNVLEAAIQSRETIARLQAEIARLSAMIDPSPYDHTEEEHQAIEFRSAQGR